MHPGPPGGLPIGTKYSCVIVLRVLAPLVGRICTKGTYILKFVYLSVCVCLQVRTGVQACARVCPCVCLPITTELFTGLQPSFYLCPPANNPAPPPPPPPAGHQHGGGWRGLHALLSLWPLCGRPRVGWSRPRPSLLLQRWAS